MAKVTKIKAKDTPEKPEKRAKTSGTGEPPKAKEAAKKAAKATEVAKKKSTKRSAEKKPFILWRPLVYLGRYLRDSWREIRQVRWPNRKTTWQMVLAVVVYTVIFMIFISLLDLLFSWLAGILFGTN